MFKKSDSNTTVPYWDLNNLHIYADFSSTWPGDDSLVVSLCPPSDSTHLDLYITVDCWSLPQSGSFQYKLFVDRVAQSDLRLIKLVDLDFIQSRYNMYNSALFKLPPPTNFTIPPSNFRTCQGLYDCGRFSYGYPSAGSNPFLPGQSCYFIKG
jgi:hypothetical protein